MGATIALPEISSNTKHPKIAYSREDVASQMLQTEIMLEGLWWDETGSESAHIRAIVQEVSATRPSANTECFIGQAVHSYIHPVFHRIYWYVYKST